MMEVGESSVENLRKLSCREKILSSKIFSFTTVITLQKLEKQLEKERAEKEELKLLLEFREENVC